jgi:hypothetical protein
MTYPISGADISIYLYWLLFKEEMKRFGPVESTRGD